MTTPKLITPSQPGTVQQDILASVVVFLVALPLCMGIAIASGVPVSAGLVTGIIGGLVVGALAGCPLQVSGPAAGLTVIVYQAVQKYGLDMLGVIVLMSGIIQILAGLMKVGTWFRAVSPAVVRGMLAGIGVLILASQFHVMFDKAPESSGIKNLIAMPRTIMQSLGAVGFPESAERGSQKAQISAMRQLQRRQQTLRVNVLDRLTASGTGEVNLSTMADEQALIVAELQSTSAALSTSYASNQARVVSLKTMLDETIQTARQAEHTLRSNHHDDAAAALAAVNSRFDTLFGGVKNHFLAACVGIVTILVLAGWKSLAPKKLQLIPPGLIAVIAGTGLAVFLVMPILYVDVPASMVDEIRFPKWSMLETAPWGELIPAAILMAVVASAETLLCCTAVDQVQNGPRTQYDKELVAQGLGNFLCGLYGALPMTGVIVRSTANIQAGGKTRLSAILHGVWLLVFIVGLSWLLKMIPTACLAAILVYTGFKLIDLKTIKNLRQFGWSEVGIYFSTVLVIVCKDLLSGVMVGFGLAIVKLLYTFSHLETKLVYNADGKSATLSLIGSATFVRLPQFAKAIESVPRGVHLHVNLEQLDYVDHACLDLLQNWSVQHEATGGTVAIDWRSLHTMAQARQPDVIPA
ncbi:MAG: SulP family inorganic anion transporter [Planctomycetota bacterium]|nr:MAG: SulP family inorganic anion transporter [Planctomycetota bacterium]